MIFLNYINYTYLNGYLEIVPLKRLKEYLPKSPKIFIERFVLISITALKFLMIKGIKKNDLKKEWLIYQSNNNFDVLINFKNKENSILKIFKDLSFRYLIIYKIIYTIPLFFKLLYLRKLNLFLLFYTSLGYYEEAYRLLKKYKPERILFANDHNPVQRAILKAANNLKIETFYFQHAHITKYFPPLDFSVSFLDGQAAYDIYRGIGKINGKVELIGNVKYLSFINKNDTTFISPTIGIAINQNDDLNRVKSLVSFINCNLKKYKITIRKHPRDQRNISFNGEYSISSSKDEGSFQFIKKLNVLIAGNSSILLEASLLGVQPIYYCNNIDAMDFDYYGFVRNDLADLLTRKEDLASVIAKGKKEDYKEKSKYFNEFIKDVNLEKIFKKYNIFLNKNSLI